MLGLWLRSLSFNVGWYVGSAIIAIVGMPILLLPRAANIAWANVWIESADGALLTPPADGRILPGITRARLLAAPHLRAREARLTLRDLDRARAIFLTSSIRLATPAGLGRSPAQRALELTARLREDPAISMKTRSYIR